MILLVAIPTNDPWLSWGWMVAGWPVLSLKGYSLPNSTGEDFWTINNTSKKCKALCSWWPLTTNYIIIVINTFIIVVFSSFISLFLSKKQYPYCWWKKSCTSLIWKIAHYLQGFIHVRWLFGISAINNIILPTISDLQTHPGVYTYPSLPPSIVFFPRRQKISMPCAKNTIRLGESWWLQTPVVKVEKLRRVRFFPQLPFWKGGLIRGVLGPWFFHTCYMGVNFAIESFPGGTFFKFGRRCEDEQSFVILDVVAQSSEKQMPMHREKQVHLTEMVLCLWFQK